MIISDQAVGLNHSWKVPAIDSRNCQLKVTSRLPGTPVPQQVALTYAPEFTRSVSFSSNDSLIMVTGKESHSIIYNRNTRKNIFQDYSNAVYGQIDRLEQYAVTVRSSGAVNVWAIVDRTAPFAATTIGEEAKTCDVSHDNKRILVTGKTTVQVFDYDSLKSGSTTVKPLVVYKREGVGFTFAQFSPGDRLIAVGCSDRTVDILHGDTYEHIRTFPTYPGTERLRFSSDGRYISGTGNSDQLGRIWEVATGEYVRGIQLSGIVDNEIVWGRGDSVLATVGYGGSVRIWDATTMTELYTIPSDHMRKIAFSNDGNFVAVGRGNRLLLWSIPRGPSTVADLSDSEWEIGLPLSVENRSDNAQGPSSASLHPNPAGSALRLVFTLTTRSDVTISITNQRGESLLTTSHTAMQAGEQSLSLDVSMLPAGMYYCTVRTSSESRSRMLFVLR